MYLWQRCLSAGGAGEGERRGWSVAVVATPKCKACEGKGLRRGRVRG